MTRFTKKVSLNSVQFFIETPDLAVSRFLMVRLTRFELIRYTLEECGFIQLDYRRLIKLDSFFKTYVIPNHKSLSNCCKSLLYLNLLPLVVRERLELSTLRFGVLGKSCTYIISFTFKLLKHKSEALTKLGDHPI